MKQRIVARLAAVAGAVVALSLAAPFAAAQGTTRQAAIKEGGSVVVAVPQNPDFLDPHLAVAAGTEEMFFNVFEGLVKPDDQGDFQPAVASSYRIAPDGSRYTFTLRQGVKFHNGRTVTVDDVKYSIERVAGIGTAKPLNAAYKNIKSVDTPDAKTVVINLSMPDADFLGFLTVAILPRGYNDQNTKPIGTGPFKFVEYVPDRHVVLAKNPDYWQKGIPHLDTVEFRIYADYNAAFLDLKAGNVDIFPRATGEQVEEIGGDYEVVRGAMNLVQLWALNNKRKPFDDVRVRRAVSYAVDPDAIIKAVALGWGDRLGSNMPKAMKKFHADGLESTYKPDIEKAKALLKEAGYPNGFETTITVPSNYTFHVDTAQVLADQLRKAGIKATIRQVEWGVWLDRVYANRDYDSTVIGLTARLSPRDFLGRYQSADTTNFVNYADPKYDETFAKAVKELDDSKRVAYYKDLQKILVDDAASVYIQDPNLIIAKRKTLGGYRIYPLYVQDMASVYYSK
jgi:peptide/nickel transport system substrate-binding protein